MTRHSLHLEVDTVSFAYTPHAQTLADISFTLEPGSSLGLVGPNGAGKTTLVKLLCGLRRPDKGTVVYNGSLLPHKVRSKLAVIHQMTAFDMFLTLRANLKNYLYLRKADVRAGMGKVDELAETLGLSDLLDQQLLTFSGGQIKKAQVLRALLIRPELLILDEPTVGLDVSSKQVVYSFVDKVKKEYQSTVIWVSHDLNEVEKNTDRVLILHSGKQYWLGQVSQVADAFDSKIVTVDVPNPQRVREELENAPGLIRVTVTGNSTLNIQVDDSVSAQNIIARLIEAQQVQGDIKTRGLTLEEGILTLIERGHRRERDIS